MKKGLLIGEIVVVAVLLFTLINKVTSNRYPTTAAVIEDGLKQAANEHKNLFVICHASWCGWCKLMDTAMQDPACKKIFQDNYVIVHIDTRESPEHKDWENPGSDTTLAKYKFNGALPFWFILDKDGRMLSECYIPGHNITIGSREGYNEKNIRKYFKENKPRDRWSNRCHQTVI